MAREQLANAFDVIGRGLGMMAQTRLQREADEVEAARREALLELEHRRGIEREMLAQTADMSRFAATQAAEESRLTRGMEHDLSLARQRAGHEERLASAEAEREENRMIQASHDASLRNIETRRRKLRDDLNSPDFAEGINTEGRNAILSELDMLDEQELDMNARFMLTMRNRKVPGFSDQIDAFLSKRATGGSAPSDVVPAGRTDAQIGKDLMDAEARTGASGGLSPQDRQQLGMPEPAVAAREAQRPAPTGAVPAAQPAQEVPAEEIVPQEPIGGANWRGRAPRDFGEIIEGMVPEKVGPRRRAELPPPLKPMPSYSSKGRKPERRAQKQPPPEELEAITALQEIRAGRTPKVADDTRAMAASRLRALGYSDQEILKLQRSNR